MRHFDKQEEFNSLLESARSFFVQDARLPRDVFSHSPRDLYLIESDLFLQRDLLEVLKGTSLTLGSSWYLIVVEPDPKTYFFRHFKRFPALEIFGFDSVDEILADLVKDPGGSPADSIAFNSRLLWAFSKEGSWSMYIDREREVALLAIQRDCGALRDYASTLPQQQIGGLF